MNEPDHHLPQSDQELLAQIIQHGPSSLLMVSTAEMVAKVAEIKEIKERTTRNTKLFELYQTMKQPSINAIEADPEGRVINPMEGSPTLIISGTEGFYRRLLQNQRQLGILSITPNEATATTL